MTVTKVWPCQISLLIIFRPSLHVIIQTSQRGSAEVTTFNIRYQVLKFIKAIQSLFRGYHPL